jgi:hypothetical protein
MHGLVTSGHRLRQRQSARRRFRHAFARACGAEAIFNVLVAASS